MSSLGVDRQVLLSSPASGFDSLPDARFAGRTHYGWVLMTVEAAADWAIVAVAMSGASLAYESLFAPRTLHCQFATLAYTALCVATLVVFLLANDGSYHGEYGPLGIRQAEHSVRVAVQASLLILLVNIMAGNSFPRGTLAFCLPAAMLLLLLEKQVVTLSVTALSSRVLDGSPIPKDCSHPVWTASRSTGDATQAHEIREDVARTFGAGYELLKRIFDLNLALAIMVATLPVWLIVAILIRLDSSGPVLFRQQRVGKGGLLFNMYKFRSMRAEAPKYAVSPNNRSDPRITRFGHFLRLTSVDELPQLLNVVKGEMSLVGPRPEMQFLVERHKAEHWQRLQVVPGMTGLWQLSLARASRIHENPQYDLYYITNRNLSLDLAILLYTPVRLVRGI